MKEIYLITEIEDISDNFICACSTLDIARKICIDDGFKKKLSTGFSEIWSTWVYSSEEEQDIEVTRFIRSINYIEK